MKIKSKSTTNHEDLAVMLKYIINNWAGLSKPEKEIANLKINNEISRPSIVKDINEMSTLAGTRRCELTGRIQKSARYMIDFNKFNIILCSVIQLTNKYYDQDMAVFSLTDEVIIINNIAWIKSREKEWRKIYKKLLKK